jgi:hypothetical protein
MDQSQLPFCPPPTLCSNSLIFSRIPHLPSYEVFAVRKFDYFIHYVPSNRVWKKTLKENETHLQHYGIAFRNFFKHIASNMLYACMHAWMIYIWTHDCDC